MKAGAGPYATPTGLGDKDRDGGSTGRMAAEKMAPKARNMQARILAAIEDAGFDGLNADECARIIGAREGSVRPRFTDLQDESRIFFNGTTRPNTYGNQARCFVVAAYRPVE